MGLGRAGGDLHGEFGNGFAGLRPGDVVEEITSYPDRWEIVRCDSEGADLVAYTHLMLLGKDRLRLTDRDWKAHFHKLTKR